MPQIIKIKEKNFRDFQFSGLKADVRNFKVEESGEDVFITFPCASELPVDMGYGKEILSMEAGAVDLTRFKNKAPSLYCHDWRLQLGVIVDAWVEDRLLYVKTKQARNEFAVDKLKDIKAEVLVGVSIGYVIRKLMLKEKGENGSASTYIATEWMPYEVSHCTVDADISVGLRSLQEENKEISIEVEGAPEEPATPEQQPTDQPGKTEETVDIEQQINSNSTTIERTTQMPEVNHEELIKADRQRSAAITALGEKHKMQDIAKQINERGGPVADMYKAIAEKFGEAADKKPVDLSLPEVGLTDKEKRDFSICKAINAMAYPENKKLQDEAAFERSVSEAAQKKTGRQARGFLIPFDILKNERRDLLAGTLSAGGAVVKTDLLVASFVELLRKKAVIQRAGAQSLNGLVGNVAIPRLTGAATAYWVGENEDLTESQQTMDQINMSPKTVGGFVDFSRKLILQSSLDVEAFVKNDLATIIALEIDRAGLYGSGSENQPLGLKYVTGLNTKDLAADAPTWAEIVDLETLISSDNADVETMKYLVNAVGRGALKTTEKASNTGKFIWDEQNMVNGYKTEVSNQLESGDYLFGNFSDLIIGLWSGLDLIVDPYKGATAGTVRVVAHQDIDIAVRHGESFARGNNTL